MLPCNIWRNQWNINVLRIKYTVQIQYSLQPSENPISTHPSAKIDKDFATCLWAESYEWLSMGSRMSNGRNASHNAHICIDSGVQSKPTTTNMPCLWKCARVCVCSLCYGKWCCECVPLSISLSPFVVITYKVIKYEFEWPATTDIG